MANPFQHNFKMIIAYEGTRYAGFQRQKNGLQTIQGSIEAAIQRITGEQATITGAGRTDAGVHAKGQVVNFFSNTHLEVAKLHNALNAVLPEDIVILNLIEVSLEFHSRFSAISKTYSYCIYTNPIRPLFARNWVYYYKYSLDVQKMQQSLTLLKGTHDFKSFQATGSSVKSTIRTISRACLLQDGSEIQIYLTADGFLYHMVRNIVGTLILVGSERLSVAGFESVIAACNRDVAGPTAPACGLCLDEVEY